MLFTDVARQLEDAATVLQAATSDNGLAEFDALAALSHRPLQSWVASRRVDLDPAGAGGIDVTRATKWTTILPVLMVSLVPSCVHLLLPETALTFQWTATP